MTTELATRAAAVDLYMAAFPRDDRDWAEHYVENATFTSTTLAAFLEDRKAWNEKGTLDKRTESVYKIEGAQALKGQPRQDLTIIDCGDALIIIED